MTLDLSCESFVLAVAVVCGSLDFYNSSLGFFTIFQLLFFYGSNNKTLLYWRCLQTVIS